MVGFLVATSDFDGSHISFRVGDVLKCTDDRKGGLTIHHKGEEELVPKEYCKSVGTLNEKRFQEQGLLGEGAFGRVTTATHPETPGTLFAIKAVSMPLASSDRFKEAMPHLLMDSHRHVIDIVKVFGDMNSVSFVMLPVAKHNLEQHLQLVASQSSDAQFALHKENIIHRDIKPQNILVDGEEILYTDFGISYEVEVATESNYTNTEGTYEWMAPEAIKIGKDNKEKSVRTGVKGDVFSLGCVIYEMLLAATPERFTNKSLPSRQNEQVLAYHLTVVYDGGFAKHLRGFEEDEEKVSRVLGPGHARYIGLTKDLLNIVVNDMLVLEGERESSDEAALRMREAAEDLRFTFWCLCCKGGF